MKKGFLVVLCMLFLFSVVAAQPPFQQFVGETKGLEIEYQKFEYFEIGQNFTVHAHVFNKSNGVYMDNTTTDCFFHGYYKNGSHAFIGEMYWDPPFDWAFDLPGEAFTGGKGSWIMQCNATDLGGFTSGPAIISITGFEPPTGFDGRFIILGFFILLILILIYVQSNINFDRWYQTILNKYNKRNFFRTFISKIGFFFMNNPFSLFYMLGAFVVMIMYDIVRVYDMQSIYSVVQVFVGIYLFGLLFIFIEILGDIHEFFSRIADDIKDMGWGLEKNG